MNVAGFHVTYCSNIHPGETWQAVEAALGASLPRIRALLNHEAPLAIGLRLSAAAASTLDDPDTLARFRAFLQAGNYYVLTINGFPYGAFHGQRVKEQVYRPDWRDSERLAYTNRLATLLAGLLSDRRDIEGSVSTVPGAFKADARSDGDALAIASNVLRHAAHLVELRDRTGSTITLAIEPEPACFIETTEEAARFFETYLFNSHLVAGIAREAGVTMTVEDVRRHVGICLDACHMAVQFEDPASALDTLRRAGVRVCKVQISSALRLDGYKAADLATALAPFAEDTYLHQVVERTGNGLTRYVDLPEALATLARTPLPATRDWRVHYHVPIFLPAMTAFETTQPSLAALVDLLKRDPICPYLEIETYTWDVLPPEYRAVDVCSAIAREMSWVRARLEQ